MTYSMHVWALKYTSLLHLSRVCMYDCANWKHIIIYKHNTLYKSNSVSIHSAIVTTMDVCSVIMFIEEAVIH